MLFIERSNRTEALFAGLAARLTAPGRDPLARAVVVVQGAGMERYLAQGIARRAGVCAGVEFPFPRPFLEQIFEVAERIGSGSVEPSRGTTPWDVERMTFALAALIDGERGSERYAPLARHLAGRDGDWRLVQLARQIAVVFDQYLTYRPDWILAWEGEARTPADWPDGSAFEWQRALFLALRERLGPGHIARRAFEFLSALGAAPPRARGPALRGGDRRALAEALRGRFPDAIEIFAVSTLPRLHLEVVRGLAQAVDVRLSILTPSQAWYSDLWRELREDDGAAIGPVASLLAGLGRLGADFQRILVETGEPEGGEREEYVDPAAGSAEASLLRRLQARLLHLDEETRSPLERVVARSDASISVHLCHGPRRELEVVASILRDAFARDPGLRPEDVVVMAPDIDAIAADIDAVFAPEQDEESRIPHRIADRGTDRRSPVAHAFRALLSLIGTRLARSAVFDWLALAPVAARYGLDEAAVESLADWAERAGVRFGLDEAHRAQLGLPAERAHTLAGGLDRLVLAHALGDCDAVVEGITPIGLDAFADRTSIGALGEVASLLERATREHATARPVVEWTRWLESLLAAAIVRHDANSHEHAALLAVFERLRTAAQATGFVRAIPFEAIRERVTTTLDETPSPQSFLAGGVTFCQLVPLRAIPFRIVVVTGLVDGAFPRSRTAVGFDAMARSPRPGDRSLRDDDRHLFLEAILSARDRLVLTVPAFDVRSAEVSPPSIVVAELLDALDASFTLESGGAKGSAAPTSLRDWLVVRHPLSATSARYAAVDRDPRLVASGVREGRAAAARIEVARDRARAQRRFLDGETPAPTASGPETLSLDELIERLLRSTRFYAREVLGLKLPRPEETVDDLDPQTPDALVRSRIGALLFDAIARGAPWESALAHLRAQPELASGIRGGSVSRELAAEVRILASLAARHRAARPLPDREFELELAGNERRSRVRLTGRLDGLVESARIEAGYARLGGRKEAALWIRHLVLCSLAAGDESLPRTSVAVGRPARDDRSKHRVLRFGSVPDPEVRLGELVDWAMLATTAPLPFFVRSSESFANAVLSEKSRKSKNSDDLAKSNEKSDESSRLVKAWREARSTFEGWDDDGIRTAESAEELETARIWEGRSPIERAADSGLAPGFDEITLAFYGPLSAARETSR